eukprot:gnl/Spiro4/16757_TR9020_c0_g1_i1.p1 gnl/Spiro4/16757_TR9020_c0_g1~~gnl/Spiro4/16757_TR9020_c0_g1_i1.p1  ORF type:complete len:388 (+),score=62.02 gnl/Spiro4/16757_TR9020_c0_g1_i1:44-1165(+)
MSGAPPPPAASSPSTAKGAPATQAALSVPPARSPSLNSSGAGAPRRKTTKFVGNYILGEELGNGSFGKVKAAVHKVTQQRVALKIFEKEILQQHKMAERLRKEIAILKLLQHPNIVRLFEVMHSRTRIFLVLELVPDGELFDRIVANKRLTEQAARRLFQQLIAGMEYCHAQGIFHRDLKPENILLSGHGDETQLKISDFGLSFLHQDENADNICFTTCGTPNYVAPEVVRRQGYDGRLSDIWSCGVILFVMLAGRLPFDEPSTTTLFRKIANAEFVWPSHFSPGARGLISKILQPDPTLRASVDDIFNDPWFCEGGVAVARHTAQARFDVSDADITNAMCEVESGSLPQSVPGSPNPPPSPSKARPPAALPN